MSEDQILSPRLLTALDDLFPGSTHVREVGLQAADDDSVWRYAAAEGLTIVSKDADLSSARGKVRSSRLGSLATERYYRARYYHTDLQRFISEDPIGFDGGLNVFAFANNNPLLYVDPAGLKALICSRPLAAGRVFGRHAYIVPDDTVG